MVSVGYFMLLRPWAEVGRSVVRWLSIDHWRSCVLYVARACYVLVPSLPWTSYLCDMTIWPLVDGCVRRLWRGVLRRGLIVKVKRVSEPWRVWTLDGCMFRMEV